MSDSVPAPAPKQVRTADAFLRNVRASQLLAPSQMDAVEAALAPWRAAEGPMPEACVRALTERNLLTAWQISTLRLQADFSESFFFLGKCKLLQPIGKGGMGNVYLAEHTTLGSKVAVKVLPKKLGDNKSSSYLERFEREARAAARMNHPNIARAQDLGTSEDARHFIVMEYIDGTDLEKRVKSDGPLSVRDAADFVRQAALGLQYAHEEGIVHRDIKPANLMVDTRGHLKILDLGLVQVDAAAGSDDTSITQMHDDKVLGTPDYMSPEQALGKRADRRSDIYSLGGTFYYLLSGHAPFEKSALAATSTSKRQARMRAHLKEPAPNVLDARPDVPIEIAELILRMMEKSPNFRPQSAQEIADSLAAWLAVTAAAAPRGQPGSSRRSTARRSRSDVSAIGEPPLRGTQPPSRPGSSSSSVAPGSGGAASDSGSGIRHSGEGSGSHSIGGIPAVGRWSESDIHAPSQSDTLRPSSSAGSTGRLPPAGTVPARAAPAVGGEGIFIDVTGGGRAAGAVPRIQPAATPAAVGPAAVTMARSRAWTGWLFRRVAGLPVVAWLSVAAAIVAGALTVATLWLAGSAADETEASSDDSPAATVTEHPSAPPTRKPKQEQPKSEQPAAKPKPRQKPAAKEGTGPSPLDNLLEPAKPAASEASATPEKQGN